MLKWDESSNNVTLSGLVMNGKESSVVIYKRYDKNYIFSCPELGVTLKLVEAEDLEDLKNQVLTIIKGRMTALIDDIQNNLLLINSEDKYVSVDINEKVREVCFPA